MGWVREGEGSPGGFCQNEAKEIQQQIQIGHLIKRTYFCRAMSQETSCSTPWAAVGSDELVQMKWLQYNRYCWTKWSTCSHSWTFSIKWAHAWCEPRHVRKARPIGYHHHHQEPPNFIFCLCFFICPISPHRHRESFLCTQALSLGIAFCCRNMFRQAFKKLLKIHLLSLPGSFWSMNSCPRSHNQYVVTRIGAPLTPNSLLYVVVFHVCSCESWCAGDPSVSLWSHNYFHSHTKTAFALKK